MVEITFPVHVETTAVYDAIVDAEGRLITFISVCERNRERAEYIAKALNEAHENETETALQEYEMNSLDKMEDYDRLAEKNAELRAKLEAANKMLAAYEAEPIPYKFIIQAIQAVEAESQSRGRMFPQDSGANAEDARAVRRVCHQIEWYATCGGAVAEHLDAWPKYKPSTTEHLDALLKRAKVAALREAAAWFDMKGYVIYSRGQVDGAAEDELIRMADELEGGKTE